MIVGVVVGDNPGVGVFVGVEVFVGVFVVVWVGVIDGVGVGLEKQLLQIEYNWFIVVKFEFEEMFELWNIFDIKI